MLPERRQHRDGPAFPHSVRGFLAAVVRKKSVPLLARGLFSQTLVKARRVTAQFRSAAHRHEPGC
jgi:hypothetical protein